MEQNIYQILQTVQIDHILMGAALLILASVFTSKLAGNLGIPALLIFLLIGMLFGSDGPGGFYFDDPWLSQLMGVTALAIILFAGGLSTEWEKVKPTFWYSITLATVGVLITAVLVGLFVSYVLGFPLVEAMLLGSVISSTDAAAVFGVLRTRRAALKGHLAPLLELESGANDPMAIFLTIGFIHLLTQPGARLFDMIPLFLTQMVFGVVIGLLAGRAIVWLLNRINLEFDGLYPVLLLALVMFVYSMVALINGSGFMAVYVAGIIIANSSVIHKRDLTRFFDSMAWLMQIMMFLTLGLLVYPSRLLEIAGLGLAVSAFLMLVARPAAVFSLLSVTKLTLQQKTLISWVGLRGAVPIVLATMPFLAGVEQADLIFHVVFFVVLTSTLLQGTSIPRVARWLGLGADMVIKPRAPLEISAGDMDSDLIEVAIPNSSAAAGKPIYDLGLPGGTLIVLINRNNDYIVPTGSTTVESGDIVMVLGSKDRLHEVRAALVSARATHHVHGQV